LKEVFFGQVFLCFGGIERVMGVELAHTRFLKAVCALEKLHRDYPGVFSLETSTSTVRMTMIRTFDPTMPTRTLEFHHGNIFEFVKHVPSADILIVEADLASSLEKITTVLCSLKRGARFLMYNNFRRLSSFTDLIECDGPSSAGRSSAFVLKERCKSINPIPSAVWEWKCPVSSKPSSVRLISQNAVILQGNNMRDPESWRRRRLRQMQKVETKRPSESHDIVQNMPTRHHR
jgi:hypothetical protein